MTHFAIFKHSLSPTPSLPKSLPSFLPTCSHCFGSSCEHESNPISVEPKSYTKQALLFPTSGSSYNGKFKPATAKIGNVP